MQLFTRCLRIWFHDPDQPEAQVAGIGDQCRRWEKTSPISRIQLLTMARMKTCPSRPKGILSDPIWCFIMDLSPVSLSIWPFWRVYTIVRQTQSRRSMKLNWPISGVLGLLFCLPLKLDTWKTDRPLWLNGYFWRKAVGILSVGWR